MPFESLRSFAMFLSLAKNYAFCINVHLPGQNGPEGWSVEMQSCLSVFITSCVRVVSPCASAGLPRSLSFFPLLIWRFGQHDLDLLSAQLLPVHLLHRLQTHQEPISTCSQEAPAQTLSSAKWSKYRFTARHWGASSFGWWIFNCYSWHEVYMQTYGCLWCPNDAQTLMSSRLSLLKQ